MSIGETTAGGNSDLVKDPRTQLKHKLAIEVLQSFGQIRLAVTGTSMLPSIWPGDILEVRRQAAQEILPGDVVLAKWDGGFMAHRVVECRAGPPLRNSSSQSGRHSQQVRATARHGETPFLLTRGDRLKTSDPPIAAYDLLGRVTSLERRGRLVDPRLTVRRRLAAWVLSRSELATRSVIYLRRTFVKVAGNLRPEFR
jgi:signal peptidase